MLRELLRRPQERAKRRIKALITPTPEMVAEARRRAEAAAAANCVPIDRICVIGTRGGRFKAVVLDD